GRDEPALPAGSTGRHILDRSAGGAVTSAAEQIAFYRRSHRRRRIFVVFLAIGCLLSFLASLIVGPSGVSPGQIIAALFGLGDRTTGVVLLQLRLPMALLAVLAGAGLGLAGAEMQTVLDNPLAEPYTLGVSSSAALGAALAIVLGISVPGFGLWGVPLNAFLFAFGALSLVQLLIRLRGAGTDMLVLFGVGVGLTA